MEIGMLWIDRGGRRESTAARKTNGTGRGGLGRADQRCRARARHSGSGGAMSRADRVWGSQWRYVRLFE